MEFTAVILTTEGGGLVSLLFHGVGLTHYSDASKNSDTQLTFVKVAPPLSFHLSGAFSKAFFCMLV